MRMRVLSLGQRRGWPSRQHEKLHKDVDRQPGTLNFTVCMQVH
jgi:hypothetical protein